MVVLGKPFEPTWGKQYSAYDPNAPVHPNRAKEIFPQDFITIFLTLITAATTAKVARLTIKELAKKNGGKAGLHDLFLERPLDLSKQLTARQIKHADKIVQTLREDCAKHVAYAEHKRKLAFGAAIRIGTYVRGYVARKLAQKRRIRKEKKDRDDYASSKIQCLVRGVQGRCRVQELKCRSSLWQRRGRNMRYLERAVVVATKHVRNDPKEPRIAFILALADSTRWNQHVIGATVTGETAPNLRDPSHPQGGTILEGGKTAVLFAHYGVMPSGGRRAPVVICRVDMKPLTRLEEFRLDLKRKASAAADPFGKSSKRRGNNNKKRKGKGKGNNKKRRNKKNTDEPQQKGHSPHNNPAEDSENLEIVTVPSVQPFHDSTSPIQYVHMNLGLHHALPASFQGCRGERLKRNEREDFYVLQHMSGFLGRDLVRYLASRRELPALASPDGSGQDGNWAKDRRRKYWETTNARHGCILPYRRRVHSVKDEKYRTDTAQRVVRYKKSNCIPSFWESVAPTNKWRLVFFQDDGVLNFEDSFRGGYGGTYQTRVNSATGQKTSSVYNITTDPYSLNAAMVERLVNICNEVGAKLICMSNRSETHALQDELTETLHNAGLPLTSFLGFTPKIETPASSTSGSSSNRLASVYSWLLEQDSRRVIESWVIVDKTNLFQGDGRDRVMVWKGSQKNATAAEVDALEMYNRAVQKGWAGEDVDLKKHFVRTNMRKGLNEERGKELRRLLLLPKLSLMQTLESSLTLRKESFEDKSAAFLSGMPKEGPFVPGLKQKEQQKRLLLFRKVFIELIKDMDYLDVNFKELRTIVDGDAFLSSDFKWDSGKHRKVRVTHTQLNEAYDKIQSKNRANELRQQEVKCLKQGGRFCPRCTQLVYIPADFHTNSESNKWLSCTSTTCLHEFCQRCGAAKGPIEAHGHHRHLFGCQFHKKLNEGTSDGPFRYWSAAAKEVKRGQKKAGDVRCQDCCNMTLETETCPAPTGLPDSWNKEKDPDPKLRRIRNALQDKAKEEKARRRK